jgi:hypothetical protein
MPERIVATREELEMQQRRGPAVFAAGVAAGLVGAIAAFASSGFGAGGVTISPAFFFGNHMVRAEVISKVGPVTHDFRLDRGTVKSVTANSITLKEKTGDIVTIPVAITADVRLKNRPAVLLQLKRRMPALVIRDGADTPAGWVRGG